MRLTRREKEQQLDFDIMMVRIILCLLAVGGVCLIVWGTWNIIHAKG